MYQQKQGWRKTIQSFALSYDLMEAKKYVNFCVIKRGGLYYL